MLVSSLWHQRARWLTIVLSLWAQWAIAGRAGNRKATVLFGQIPSFLPELWSFESFMALKYSKSREASTRQAGFISMRILAQPESVQFYNSLPGIFLNSFTFCILATAGFMKKVATLCWNDAEREGGGRGNGCNELGMQAMGRGRQREDKMMKLATSQALPNSCHQFSPGTGPGAALHEINFCTSAAFHSYTAPRLQEAIAN